MALFQNTPAAFQGRPELSERLTEGCDRLSVLHPMKSNEEALLMLLVYYGLYITFILSGFLFDIGQSNVCRNLSSLEHVLAHKLVDYNYQNNQNLKS
jgi:hypothetical protein